MTMRLSGVAVAWALANAALGQAPSEWRAFRGDGSAISADRGLPTTWGPKDNIVWKTDLPGAGTSTPVVIGDKVFVTSYSGFNVPGRPSGRQADLKLHLSRLDRATGKIVWTRDVDPKGPEQDNIRDGHGYASHTPAVDDASVFVFFGKSGVLAFDHDGKQLWRVDVGSKLNGWGSAASPLLVEGRVVVNASVESERLVALHAKTGAEAWSLPKLNEAWNTPILVKVPGGAAEIVVAKLGHILGVDPKTGAELWRCRTDIPWYMVPSMVASEGVVYALGGRPGGGLAVKAGGRGDVTATHRLWTSKKGTNVSSPIVFGKHLYWAHDNLGIVFCAEASTGKILYEERLGRGEPFYGSPVLADGKIYYPGRLGTTFVVAASPKFELLASNTFGERGMYNASPAVAGGKLFLRTDRYVCCVGSR